LIQPSPAAEAHRQHPPVEAEERYYAMLDEQKLAALYTPNSRRQTR
jgi:hypothetical protein